jgi:CheY-like chemotaxis protein
MITFSAQELQTRVLVVENIVHMAKIIVEVVRSLGFRDTHWVSNVLHAYQFVAEHRPGLIIGEAVIQPQGVTRLCKSLRLAADSPAREVPVIITIAEPTGPAVAAARDAGCYGIVAKPISATALGTKIAAALRNPPRFVATKGYTGPDRRRVAMPLKAAERRGDRMVPADHSLGAHALLGIDAEVLAGIKSPPPHLVADDNDRSLVAVAASVAIRKVLISHLEAGMELAEPIKAGSGLVVVPRGVVLTRELVPRLADLAGKGKIPNAVVIRA